MTTMPGTPEYASAYHGLRLRVTDLVASCPSDQLVHLAPTTPEWRVRDIVGHLGGVCDDIAHGNIDGVATNAWTKAQVDKRYVWPLERVLDDWSEHATTVEPLMNSFGQPIGQMVFDAWTHEQDIRGALGIPGARDGDALEISWDWFVTTNQSPPGEGAERPGSLLLITEMGETSLGSGGEPTTTIRTTRFEFLRALTGRRSRAQVRALDQEGEPIDDVLFFSDFFSPATSDITE